MPPKHKKKPGAQLERMLLETVPETPIPQPYFTIPSPTPYRFPLSQTLLQGVKLLEQYEPEDTNTKMRNKLPNSRIQRMIRFRDTFCMMGKGGNGLLIDQKFLNIRGASAFAYGPTHLMIAYEDLRLEVYTLQLKLIKTLKSFSHEKITFLKILQVPKNFQSIVFLAHSGKRVFVHRLEKSLFSTLSCKLTKAIIERLEYPVTQIMEIPAIFRFYLRKDKDYRDCSLVCISAVNKLFILRINHFRIELDDFITIDHVRMYPQVTTNSVSWGQANIQAPSRFISGDKLVLTYSFGQQIYFLALRQIDKYIGGEVVVKYEWVESYPFFVDEGKVAFCQYMKKNQILIITEENQVIIFHTKKFDIFEKQNNTRKMEIISEKGNGNLEARKIWTMQTVRRQPQTQMERPSIDMTEEERNIINQVPLVTYADTFQYEYPSNQIFFLTQKKFSIYLYCDWKIIANLMKVEQKYESAMLFLIAMYKKANKFDLGVEGSENQMSQFIQMLTIQYINNKLSKIKAMPQIIQKIMDNHEYFKMLVTPIEFLTQTNEFIFLFDIAKDKIISALMVGEDDHAYSQAQRLFYEALIKFIEHGRIKYIPQQQLISTLKYFTQTQNLGMLDRLAIYFDLSRIDRNIVIQCLLNNNLVVSLAHICTQGNQSEFVTPFVKFWGISENYRRLKNLQYAAMFALRALWYVQLCLQRNWALKEHSFEKYASLIRILSQHFLTQKIITGLLSIKPEYCLQTLGFYFTIENAQIISDMSAIKLKLTNVKPAQWIINREGFQQLQLLLSAIYEYLILALKRQSQANKLFNLFLSSIIIYKTIKFNKEKYLDILISLIDNHEIIEGMKFGVEEKIIDSFKEKYQQYDNQELNRILSARYINKILTLVFYQCHQYIKPKLSFLLEKATEKHLTDFQAEITFLQGNYRRCIEIYTRAKPPANLLVFEFLQNSFKRLILEKKKMEKRNLAHHITQEIKWMVKLDPKETKKIVQFYIPQIQEELINALKDDEALQLDFLEGIVNDENLIAMKNNLSDESVTRFVELMAKHKKQNLLQAFKNNPRFATEQTLRVCEEYNVYDCMQYLYERMGNIIASVKIAAKRIDEILQLRMTDFDDHYEQAPYIKIKQILDNSILVCKKNHSEEIWQSLLDSFIKLYEDYLKKPSFPEEELEIFFYINGEVMEHLASNCPIQHTIDLLQNKYQNLNMGGKMTKAFINILSNLSHSINIFYIVRNLTQGSLHTIQLDQYQKKLECYSTASVCESCGYGIIKSKRSIHFYCGHCYHFQCMVNREGVNTPICISCLKKQNDQFDYYLNTLNPQHPKIKKIRELFQKFDEKKLQMSETFRIQEFQQVESREKNNQIKEAKAQKKRAKMKNFDESVNELEVGDRRVLRELHI